MTVRALIHWRKAQLVRAATQHDAPGGAAVSGQEAEAAEEQATQPEMWSLPHDSRCDRDLCHPDCKRRQLAEESDMPYPGRK